MLVFNKNHNGKCSCCGIVRKHPQKIRHAARDHWSNCLKVGQCPKPNVPSNNVLAPSSSNQKNCVYLIVQLVDGKELIGTNF